MHAILFQAALLPLTMARLSIASLSQSFLDNLIPLNRALHMHIHLGYTMITIVILAICLFFTFFGLLCSDGDQAFCDKFTTEIMITGYVIFFVLLLVGGTSYLRHTIRYELFYAIHHVVFIMYAITVAHTMDVEQRTGAKDRSQTFKWFSLSLLYYLCDRTAMHLNHRYTSRLLGSSTPVGSTTDDSRMVLLKMNRPVLFRFKPGQYAFLRVPAIDAHWHPFSIASGPDSSILEFYVDVAGEKSWTNKLWNLLTVNTQSLSKKNGLGQSVEIMGPYGTSLAKTEEFSHVLAIGAGTGTFVRHHHDYYCASILVLNVALVHLQVSFLSSVSSKSMCEICFSWTPVFIWISSSIGTG
jgi:predicted ferric reductase